ncbi:hypothetical protein F441_21702 [Phytophthora nicotianae CJ01A1]|uniref:Uncharacterized protein n=4 Tax=Phytophthora nicotianae TaxID=4792 RepID=W2Y2D8_PHYNI|nr:hypothetical protein L915_21215 [Phytophthora nicotianae]ETL78238.1 hypothetical protein L917_20939 [Phytophthora nicotianae]ETM31499.1 hypothetical protein L914_20956 [Phytophthora nicotianae]ETP00999.1 hypothetical protein F441_21702 [Phytophthora nicotianae CJ01A1]ETP29141.1 hypothetical protein F442_21681 [Phytophthora nicotianae P10297]
MIWCYFLFETSKSGTLWYQFSSCSWTKMTMKQEQETKTPAPTTHWKKSFNEQEQEEIELSIKSVKEFSQELERVRTAMKTRSNR